MLSSINTAVLSWKLIGCCIFVMPAKSYYRKHIEEVTKESKIQKWMFATPEEDIDDPTGEIRRLKKQVQRIIPGVSGRCKLHLGVKIKFKTSVCKGIFCIAQ